MTERFFSTFQIASLLRVAPGAVAEWMAKGWLNSSSTPEGVVQITESDLVSFLEDQGFDFGEEFTHAVTPEQRDEVYRRARDRKADANDANDPVSTAEAMAPEAPKPDQPGEPVDAAQLRLRAEQICDAILADAMGQGAQAVHLTPHRDRLKLQLWINSSPHDKPHFGRRLPDDLGREIIACLLDRANLDIAPEDLTVPRRVEFTRSIEGQQLTLRMSAMPTVNGPRLVISIPHRPDDQALVLEDTARIRLEKLLQGDGLIVVASKRKTGRDRTLRALLADADTDGRSVIAIERNSEPYLDDVIQLQINPASGLTFATAMAAMEYQNADTIVLTELRDPATAFGAFDAAHDGALVIAGINANSALTATGELLAMGLEPWPLGTTLKAIVEQTVVRTLCGHCDGGCERCRQTGWSGRTVLSGVVFIEGRLAELIRTGGSSEQFAQAIVQTGPGSLAHAAQAAVDAGITTPAEVAHILAIN